VYLLKNPEAKDSAEGICKWWLHQGGEERPVQVKEVLNWLVKQRWVKERSLPSSSKNYSANEKRFGEIRQYLKGKNS